ncbi:MAG: DUF177 domain-containing protein [Zetaproteobacteria bacterium]|nr:MAG: DUF177 domain-containing protein [Zetaproteobacteria bacterium]
MQQQWDIILRDLPEQGCAWDVSLPRSVMADVHVGTVQAIEALCGDVHWRGEIARKGECYHLTGHWQAAIRRQCCRCLRQFDWQVAGDVVRDFRLAQRDGAPDDEDVLPPPGELALVDLVREEIWLAWRGDVPCDEACKGLCPSCGCDLNTGSCHCREDNDHHPFAALRKLKL